MNLIGGSYERSGHSRFEQLRETVRELYGRPLEVPGDPREATRASGAGANTDHQHLARIGSIRGEGIVIGRASDDTTTLLLLGGLHRPLFGWAEGNPADDPDRAAEWLLDRYRDTQRSFLDNVHGQFTVLVHDREANRFLAACDGSGLRSLFLHEDEGGVAIASNLFTLARALRDRVQVDRSMEDFFLVYGYLPDGRTIFQNIITLPPGILHIWEDERRETRPIETGDPWAERFPPLSLDTASEDVVIERLYEAFMTATEEQTGSAKEAAVLLGGVDSALVASALHRLGKDVTTFSFHYEAPGFDQPHTDTLSRFLGSRHEWVPITPDVMREGLNRYGLVFSRPTNWPNYVIQTARVCEVIREHGIDHVHSGDGADHTFMGYPRTHSVAKAYQALPNLHKDLGRWLAKAAARPLLERLLGRPYRVGMGILRSLSRPMPERGFLTFRIFDESSLTRLRCDPPPAQMRSNDAWLRELTGGLESMSPARLAYVGKAAVSANKAKLGGSSDLTGVIAYAPYLHAGLKRFSSALPDHLLRPKNDPSSAVSGKYVLLRMAERKGMLPREVIYQEKVAAVDAPVDRWYANALRTDLLDLLDHLPFRANQKYLERLLEPTAAARFYGDRLSSDRLTSHEASLLATYAALARALE